ncbi:MAG: hypothetical protein U1F77_09020 [Kiritimatiellia bacterium]
MKLKFSWILLHGVSVALGGLAMLAQGWFFLLGPVAIASLLAMLTSLRSGNAQLRRIGNLGAAFVPLAYLAVFILRPVLAPGISRRESIRLLTESAKEGHPETAENGLGIFLKYPDGNWLAIRYEDSHAAPGWSMAVALDSQGSLYESNYHFCGSLGGYKYMVERHREFEELDPEEANPPLEFSGEMALTHALASAPDLQTAIPLLLRMHFRPLAK